MILDLPVLAWVTVDKLRPGLYVCILVLKKLPYSTGAFTHLFLFQKQLSASRPRVSSSWLIMAHSSILALSSPFLLPFLPSFSFFVSLALNAFRNRSSCSHAYQGGSLSPRCHHPWE